MDHALHLGVAAPAETWSPARVSRTVAFMVIGAYIVCAPMAKQFLGINSVLLRQWTMFSGVGAGILKGNFTVRGGEERTLTPLQVLGIDHYPIVLHYQFPDRVFRDEDTARIAARFCATLLPGETLAYEGWVGTPKGWRPLSIDNVCAPAP